MYNYLLFIKFQKKSILKRSYWHSQSALNGLVISDKLFVNYDCDLISSQNAKHQPILYIKINVGGGRFGKRCS